MNWHIYIILCSDNSLYTGITTDIDRRLHQHATGRGAKYFRGRQPTRLVYLESGHNRSSAGKREAAIKRMSRAGKCLLASSEYNEIKGGSFSLLPRSPVPLQPANKRLTATVSVDINQEECHA